VIERKGLFCALYSDRGSHFWLTPKAGGKVDSQRLTQVGAAGSGDPDDPSVFAAGAGAFGAQLRDLARAPNRRSCDCAQSRGWKRPTVFCARTISRVQSPFSSSRSTAWQCLCRNGAQEPGPDLLLAVFNLDNTVSFQNLVLQIQRVPWRATLAGCSVTVHQHLDGTISLTYGPHRLGHYTSHGVALEATQNGGARSCGRLTKTGHFTCYKKRTF
jgi:hypothetical protein